MLKEFISIDVMGQMCKVEKVFLRKCMDSNLSVSFGSYMTLFRLLSLSKSNHYIK